MSASSYACECEPTTGRTVFTKDLLQFLVVHVLSEVLDVDVGELLSSGSELSLAFFARFEAAHKPARVKTAIRSGPGVRTHD